MNRSGFSSFNVCTYVCSVICLHFVLLSTQTCLLIVNSLYAYHQHSNPFSLEFYAVITSGKGHKGVIQRNHTGDISVNFMRSKVDLLTLWLFQLTCLDFFL